MPYNALKEALCPSLANATPPEHPHATPILVRPKKEMTARRLPLSERPKSPRASPARGALAAMAAADRSVDRAVGRGRSGNNRLAANGTNRLVASVAVERQNILHPRCKTAGGARTRLELLVAGAEESKTQSRQPAVHYARRHHLQRGRSGSVEREQRASRLSLRHQRRA